MLSFDCTHHWVILPYMTSSDLLLLKLNSRPDNITTWIFLLLSPFQVFLKYLQLEAALPSFHRAKSATLYQLYQAQLCPFKPTWQSTQNAEKSKVRKVVFVAFQFFFFLKKRNSKAITVNKKLRLSLSQNIAFIISICKEQQKNQVIFIFSKLADSVDRH